MSAKGAERALAALLLLCACRDAPAPASAPVRAEVADAAPPWASESRAPAVPRGMVWIPEGTLLATAEALVGYADDRYVRVDPGTGVLTDIGLLNNAAGGNTKWISSGDVVSIKDDDPFALTLERALELVAEKQRADAERLIRDFPEAGIQVLKGRYGPYITDRVRNAKVPKDREPATLTLEECRALLAEAPERKGRLALQPPRPVYNRPLTPPSPGRPERHAGKRESGPRPQRVLEPGARRRGSSRPVSAVCWCSAGWSGSRSGRSG